MFGIRMVTFDITGTLLQFRDPIAETYARFGQAKGIKVDRIELRDRFLTQYKRMTVEHPLFGRSSGLGSFQWWTNVVRGTFEEFSKSEKDEESVAKAAHDLIRFFQTADAWTVQPGSHQLLDFLKRSYFKVGVISNFDDRLHSILKVTDLEHYFDFVLTSYEVGFEKPDPRIFQEAIRCAKNVSPSEAVHIGNDVRTDYLAAKSAGWSALLVAPEMNEIPSSVERQHIFPDLVQVKNYFKTFL